MKERFKNALQDVLLFTVISASLITYKLVSAVTKIFKKKKHYKKTYFCDECSTQLNRGNGVYVIMDKKRFSFCNECIRKVKCEDLESKRKVS